MKSRIGLWSIAMCLFAALALTSQLTAQADPQRHPKHHQYKLYDVGTFGGPNSEGSFQAITLSTKGFIGFADTAIRGSVLPKLFCGLHGCPCLLMAQWDHTRPSSVAGQRRRRQRLGFGDQQQ